LSFLLVAYKNGVVEFVPRPLLPREILSFPSRLMSLKRVVTSIAFRTHSRRYALVDLVVIATQTPALEARKTQAQVACLRFFRRWTKLAFRRLGKRLIFYRVSSVELVDGKN
jgi:hypothetical protein